MKKIINGRLYNTETATLVGSYSNWANDVHYKEKKELYHKCTDEYFILVEGGALTKYGVPCDDNMTTEGTYRDGAFFTRGYQIIPLSLEQAKEWAKKYLDADEYWIEFGEVEE